MTLQSPRNWLKLRIRNTGLAQVNSTAMQLYGRGPCLDPF